MFPQNSCRWSKQFDVNVIMDFVKNFIQLEYVL